ncbi:MAG: hypothetical protein FWC26_04415 [Fibromonadales bacterium]|nr:hypothetical protein [Fibromonadales bacterium]
MDFSSILTRETCAKCRNCCVFKKESLIYVPEGIGVKEQSDGMFVCEHCRDSGCALGKNKPMECAAWPFSIAKRGNELLLVLERSCKELKNTETVKKVAQETIAPPLLEYSKRHLNAIRAYNELLQAELFQVGIL